ncbi:MAG: hypothetical protein AAF709_15765, partial [Pseudomonadota bacterium]
QDNAKDEAARVVGLWPWAADVRAQIRTGLRQDLMRRHLCPLTINEHFKAAIDVTTSRGAAVCAIAARAAFPVSEGEIPMMQLIVSFTVMALLRLCAPDGSGSHKDKQTDQEGQDLRH